MQNDSVVIVGMARTPQGKLLGALKDISGNQLGTIAIQSAIARAGINASGVSEVLMGCVLPAGQGQAPARQAALNAGLPTYTSCTTVNKVCGSGMKTVMLAHDALLTQKHGIYIAGGMESMSNAPYLLLKARQGYRLGHSELIDHMQWDGLEDAYDRGRSMGYFAEMFAKEWGFSRAEQDAYAMRSLERAQNAIRDNKFAGEMTPVTVSSKQGEIVIQTDEHPGSVKIEKIPLLAPAFVKDGTITAANSSSIADGAAAMVLMHAAEAAKQGIKPLARIISHSSYGKKPEEFTSNA
jgi:acetyl-CoA C-acetyltransferase